MPGFIALPLPLRALLIALIALAAARFVNWAIYRWSFDRSNLGPWKPPLATPSKSKKGNAKSNGGLRSWQHHLPIFGWYRMREELDADGKPYWLRPFLIEITFPILIAIYYWQYTAGGSLPLGFGVRGLPPMLVLNLHWQFLAHFVLFTLMMIATFIDFDEQSIPDFVTVPGTVIGLLGAALAPAWLPYNVGAGGIEELHANIPAGWPFLLDGQKGLIYGLLIVVVWAFALLDRRWIGRRGVAKGIQYFFVRMFRSKNLWLSILGVSLFMLIGIYLGWKQLNPGRWQYLLSSLFGLAFAGGVTWAVRLAGTAGLRVEALGFGDVTLMAMIGTYVGWQPSLLVFFLAPLVAILFVLVRWAITGDAATPYGPYLCAAVVILLVFWDGLWTRWAAPTFMIGPKMILGIVVGCVVLMGVMLWIWRLFKEAFGLAGH